MTILDEAQSLLEDLLEDPRSETRDGWPWTVGELPSSDGGSHLVVTGQPADRGLLAAHQLAERMVRAWRPRSLIVADCGGGIHGGRATRRKGITLGDVVVSQSLQHYEPQKLEPGGTRRALDHGWQGTSPELSNIARKLDQTEPIWLQRLHARRPDDGTPKIHYGELICGDKLLSDPDAAEVEELIQRYPRALAVDMETVAFAHTALAAIDPPLSLAMSFIALRGISDWIDLEGNQSTRDAWREAACDAAVSAAVGTIRATPAAVSGTSLELDSLRKLRDGLGEYPVPERPYGSIISTEDDQTLSRNDALVFAAETNGAVLVGDAGMGKSSVLHHAVLGSMSPLDPFPVLVDLKQWRPEYGERLANDPSGDELLPSLDSLLRASVQKIGCETLEEIATRRSVMLFVDGLNEVPYAETGRLILTLLEEYMRLRPNVRVLVSDRTAGELYAENHWQVLHLQPLAAAEVGRIVESELGMESAKQAEKQPLLRTPFFLDRALRGGRLALASRAGAVREFFNRHLGISAEELGCLAQAALSGYTELHRRTFPASLIEQTCGRGTLSKLRSGGAIVEGGDELRFDHQIEHDFLAAMQLSASRSSWTPATLDAVTFEAANFDVLGLTLEQIEQEADRDQFLRSLYNWNWRGTIATLAEAEQAKAPSGSSHLRTALLTVVAEKRFDRVAGTRSRSTQQLEVFSGELAAAMAAAPSLEALVDLIKAQPKGPSWFEEWRELFCQLPDQRPLDPDKLGELDSEDPVLGWTAANIARRFPAATEVSARVREVYLAHGGTATAQRAARWRAVHTLGAWPSADNSQLLLGALADEYMWVKYGAVRSLTEMAATTADPDLRQQIIEGLQARLTELPDEPLSQIAYTSRYHGADAEFASLVRPLLTQILAAQSNESERHLWQGRIERFDRFWDS